MPRGKMFDAVEVKIILDFMCGSCGKSQKEEISKYRYEMYFNGIYGDELFVSVSNCIFCHAQHKDHEILG